MGLEERFDYMEFRMDLLKEGTDLSKFLYDSKISREQLYALYEIMDYYRDKCNNGEKISSSEYESKVLSVVDNKSNDYHFCELFAKLLWEEKSYEEVFPALYGDSPKFQYLFR